MNTLQSIQKTFKVFEKISRVLFILCVIGAGMSAMFALFAVSQYHGGTVFSLLGEPLKIFSDSTDLTAKYSRLSSSAIMLTAEAVLLFFARDYFKSELNDGTPFTESGAQKIKKLGIRFIYIPIIALTLCGIISVLLKTESAEIIGNFPNVITGIVLILVSLVFRYGAQIEQNTVKGDILR